MLRKAILLSALLLPAIAVGDDELTNENIDLFLKVMPTATKVMASLQKKLGSDEEINKKMMSAASKNEMYRTVIDVAADTSEMEELAVEVKAAGYESLADWAYTGDRITSVYMVGAFVNAFAPISYGNKGFAEGADVFEFVKDESKAVEVRNELRAKLEESCATDCIVPADLNSVGARIGDIAKAFGH